MRIAVTGTPGTGKTTATSLLESRPGTGGDLEVINLGDIIESEGLYTSIDEDRDSKIADLEAIDAWLDGRTDIVLESHLAHHFHADRVAVLRCHPRELKSRLLDRGESEQKARENAESEALDVILVEAVERHGLESVYEIDTTDRAPDAVAGELEAVVRGDSEPSAGEVDYVGYLS